MARPDDDFDEFCSETDPYPASVFPATLPNGEPHPQAGQPTPWSGQPRIVSTGLAANVAAGAIPATPFPAEHLNGFLRPVSRWARWMRDELRNLIDGTNTNGNTELRGVIELLTGGIFGFGTNNVTNSTEVSSIQDSYYRNFTVTDPGVRNTNQWRIFASESVTIGNNGQIAVAPGLTSGGLGPGQPGGVGGASDGAPGTAGVGTLCLGGDGGAGGIGANGGASLGGAGGVASLPTLPHLGELPMLRRPRYSGGDQFLRGGGGGGGGGAGTTSNGGGTGGYGGGIIFVAAPEITILGGFTPAFRARGEDGESFAVTGTNRGGGGGGGGGAVILVYRRLNGFAVEQFDVRGGAGGVGSRVNGESVGNWGSPGAQGRIYRVDLSAMTITVDVGTRDYD